MIFYLNSSCCIILFQAEEAERYWFAFISYSVKKLIHNNEEAGKEENVITALSLCRILRATKLKYFTGLLTSMLVCTLYVFILLMSFIFY